MDDLFKSYGVDPRIMATTTNDPDKSSQSPKINQTCKTTLASIPILSQSLFESGKFLPLQFISIISSSGHTTRCGLPQNVYKTLSFSLWLLLRLPIPNANPVQGINIIEKSPVGLQAEQNRRPAANNNNDNKQPKRGFSPRPSSPSSRVLRQTLSVAHIDFDLILIQYIQWRRTTRINL